MNQRQIEKEETRQKILAAARQEFLQNGLLNSSTVDIARRAGVAHGTVFFHFNSKEALVTDFLNSTLMNVTAELDDLLNRQVDLGQLLATYLDFLEREEDLFSMLARETPLLPAPLRRIVIGREMAIRKYFLAALETAIPQENLSGTKISDLLNILFGNIQYYLSMRSIFTSSTSVIAEKRQAIVDPFLTLINTYRRI